jgi:predicted glutamine amidotransferase
MCRMALIISKKPVSRFETAFKSAWVDGNDDGVGIYWRDTEKGLRHLARFPKSADLSKVGATYDRMLIHFRKSTKGEGTHPFTCKHRKELDSGNWLLVHNGCVQDEEARKELEKTHKFSTEIDSEVFVHLWGEIKEKDLAKRAKKFNAAREKANVTGWANLIFYNVVTDEWVAFSDGAIRLVYNKETLVVCSDDNWLDAAEAQKRKIQNNALETNAIAYGKGLRFKTKTNVWKIHYAYSNQTTSCETNGAEVWEPQKLCRWDAKQKTFVDADGKPLAWDAGKRTYVGDKFYSEEAKTGDDYSQYGNPHGHPYTPSTVVDDKGEEYCDICFLGQEFHDLLTGGDEKDEDERDTGLTESKWNKKHPFTRDPLKKTITCECGSTSGYGVIHTNHEFKPVLMQSGKPSTYCSVCGNERPIGNHREDNPNNHFFTPFRIERTKGERRFFEDTEICGRCGFRSEVHEMNYGLQTKRPAQKKETVSLERMRPMGCDCRPDNKPTAIVCHYHWTQGWQYVDDEGFLIKKVAYDSGASETD